MRLYTKKSDLYSCYAIRKREILVMLDWTDLQDILRWYTGNKRA